MESAVGDSAYIIGFDVRPLAKMQLVGWNRPWLVSLQSTWTWFFRSMDLFFLINGRLECHVQKKQGM